MDTSAGSVESSGAAVDAIAPWKRLSQFDRPKLAGGAFGDIVENSTKKQAIIWGNKGSDVLVGCSHTGILYSSSPLGSRDTGFNYLYCRAGNDTLEGSSGVDEIVGQQGKDSLYGFGGSDELGGGSQNDRRFGDLGE